MSKPTLTRKNTARATTLASAVLGLLACSLSTGVNATILTFDGATLENLAVFPTTYGERVTTTDDLVNFFQYGLGNGFTPNISISYTVIGNTAGFSHEQLGYGDLTNVLTHSDFGVNGEIRLTPDPGYEVRLNSFDVAAWTGDPQGTGSFPSSRVQILDVVARANLFDSGIFTAEFTAGRYTYPTGPISSASGLIIVLDNFGDLAVDNINFDQVAVVPAPAGIWLLGTGVAAIWLRSRRKAAA